MADIGDGAVVHLDPDLIRRIIEKERATVLAEVDRRYGAADRADVVDVVLHFGSVGTVLEADEQAILRLGLNCRVEVIGWSLGGNVSATCVVDVLVGDTLAGAASICGATKPTLTAAREVADIVLLPGLTDWMTRLGDPKWVVGVIDSNDTAEVLSLTLRCRKLAQT